MSELFSPKTLTYLNNCHSPKSLKPFLSLYSEHGKHWFTCWHIACIHQFWIVNRLRKTQPPNAHICTSLVCKSKLQSMNTSNAAERAWETEQTSICQREINIWHFLCLSGIERVLEVRGCWYSKGLVTRSMNFKPIHTVWENCFWVIRPGTIQRDTEKHQTIVFN